MPGLEEMFYRLEKRLEALEAAQGIIPAAKMVIIKPSGPRKIEELTPPTER